MAPRRTGSPLRMVRPALLTRPALRAPPSAPLPSRPALHAPPLRSSTPASPPPHRHLGRTAGAAPQTRASRKRRARCLTCCRRSKGRRTGAASLDSAGWLVPWRTASTPLATRRWRSTSTAVLSRRDYSTFERHDTLYKELNKRAGAPGHFYCRGRGRGPIGLRIAGLPRDFYRATALGSKAVRAAPRPRSLSEPDAAKKTGLFE